MTTEQTNEKRAPNPAEMEHIRKASTAFIDTIVSLNMAGIAPPAIATGVATAYVNFMATVAAAMKLDRASVIGQCVEGVQMLEEYAFHVYDHLAAEITAEEAAAAAAVK
jgi:hypothetical protein